MKKLTIQDATNGEWDESLDGDILEQIWEQKYGE